MTVLEAVMMMAFVMSRRRCRRKEKSDVLLSNVVALRIFVVTITWWFYCILNINIAGASKMSLKGKVAGIIFLFRLLCWCDCAKVSWWWWMTCENEMDGYEGYDGLPRTFAVLLPCFPWSPVLRRACFYSSRCFPVLLSLYFFPVLSTCFYFSPCFRLALMKKKYLTKKTLSLKFDVNSKIYIILTVRRRQYIDCM